VGQRRFNNHLIAKLTTNLERFAPNYGFSIEGTNRVAGKMARLIVIDPKDAFRYGYRLWVDEKTALLLKTELLDNDGKVLEQMMFANIEVVDKIPDAMLQPGVSGEKYTWHGKKSEGAQTQDADPGWRVANLPNGFVVSGQFKQTMPNSDQPADHMIISDGLASISVYIEPFGVESQAFVGASRMGALNVFGAVFEDHQVTVVGEVPQATVEMIAQSIKYQSQKETP
jgi:sigma-E factor negative regulatory protein RseB